ncbi:class I SAM-dependent methyltransferase [Winogradskyella endarachnes]|uniref:Methyltransferase domain-containing protein n=1 Tax=Winogradskyella endarachnes TaxID=2681965 RepID=A0A6L6UEB3_9FLAO|nr:class I SAM-dependent methyltransferase [Winogradskyella endarachnes]MUU79282.1 methyltransferase domain-containing protein [Winogradskyella endarachnes]
MNKEMQYQSISKGFSKIYEHYEVLSQNSLIDKAMRQQVYNHINRFIKPNSRILELNSGSGIDAVYFASRNHKITATDISEGSKTYINKKIKDLGLNNLNFKHYSFLELEKLKPQKYNYAFSNFGGLNCTNEIEVMAKSLNAVLEDNAVVTMVVMGKYYPWDWIYALKGKFKRAFIRFNKNGTTANIEGEAVTTYYHTPKQFKNKMSSYFNYISSENLGVCYPSVNHTSITKFKKFIKFLIVVDSKLRQLIPVGIGDYYIMSFRKK